MKDAEFSHRQMLKEVERQSSISGAYKQLHYDLVDNAFLPEHSDKDKHEFTAFYKEDCEKNGAPEELVAKGPKPKSGECDETIRIASFVADMKGKEGSKENTQEALFRHKDLLDLHFFQFNMMFYTMHIGMSANEYKDFIIKPTIKMSLIHSLSEPIRVQCYKRKECEKS